MALKLAGRIDLEGATPSMVRELRYALLGLGVSDLEPYRVLMRATKAAIDRSDGSLPTLAAQLREQEQTCRRLGTEPANAPLAEKVRDAANGLVALWSSAWDEFINGRAHDWDAHRRESVALWSVINRAGGAEVFPNDVERAGNAFEEYWQGRRFHRQAALPTRRDFAAARFFEKSRPGGVL